MGVAGHVCSKQVHGLAIVPPHYVTTALHGVSAWPAPLRQRAVASSREGKSTQPAPVPNATVAEAPWDFDLPDLLLLGLST